MVGRVCVCVCVFLMHRKVHQPVSGVQRRSGLWGGRTRWAVPRRQVHRMHKINPAAKHWAFRIRVSNKFLRAHTNTVFAVFFSTLFFVNVLQVWRGVRKEESQCYQHEELWGPVPNHLQRRPPNHLQAASQYTPVQLHGGSRCTTTALFLFPVRMLHSCYMTTHWS